MILYSFIVGTILGSFILLVAHRLPIKKSVVWSRSQCDVCLNNLLPKDLLPIISYIRYKGQCRMCGTPLSLEYPIIEFICGLLSVVSYLCLGLTYHYVFALLLMSILMIIALIDIQTFIINDRFQLIILSLGILKSLILKNNLGKLLILFGLVLMIFGLLAYITKGIGFGDVKLLAVSSTLLGPSGIILAYCISVITASLYVAIKIVILGQKTLRKIAFAPFICLGVYTSYLYAPNLIQMYLKYVQIL